MSPPIGAARPSEVADRFAEGAGALGHPLLIVPSTFSAGVAAPTRSDAGRRVGALSLSIIGESEVPA
jgi:hypothetical protein